MTRVTNCKPNSMKTAKPLLTALLVSCSMSGLTGCTLLPKAKVLDPNRDAARMSRDVPYTPPCDGYFVPDARMLELLDKLSQKDVFGK